MSWMGLFLLSNPPWSFDDVEQGVDWLVLVDPREDCWEDPGVGVLDDPVDLAEELGTAGSDALGVGGRLSASPLLTPEPFD